MKFMINGAVTLGTLDGANVEIHEAVGDDNIILFGMTTPQVNDLKKQGYHPEVIAENNADIRHALRELSHGLGGVDFHDVVRLRRRRRIPTWSLPISIPTARRSAVRVSFTATARTGSACAS